MAICTYVFSHVRFLKNKLLNDCAFLEDVTQEAKSVCVAFFVLDLGACLPASE